MGSITGTASVITEKLTPDGKHPQHREPLKLKGVLDQYEHFDVTPTIGREYPSLNLKEVLEAPNSDEILRDLAIIGKQVMPLRSS